MNDLSCLPKDVQKCVLFPYLNPQSLLSLAICSKALYQVMKQSVAYWEARLLALGCDQKELNKIPQFSVTAYQRLCFQLERFPLLKFFASEEAWQLCCLSGDISAMEQVHRAGWLTGQTISDHGRYGGNGKNALHYAACGGSIEAMQFAINTLGIAAQGVDRAGMNALHYAAQGGSVEAMQFAVEKLNILANSTDVFGMNALHYAAEGGSPKAMEFAVHTLHIPAESVSTESTVPDKNALHYAVWSGSVEAVGYAVNELGISAQSKDHNERNALHHAVSRGREAMIRYLIEKFPILATSVDRCGQNILHCAVWFSDGTGIRLLQCFYQLNEMYQLQLDPYMQDNQGHDVFWYAADVWKEEQGKRDFIVEILHAIADQTLQQEAHQSEEHPSLCSL